MPHSQPNKHYLHLISSARNCSICATQRLCFGGQLDAGIQRDLSKLTEPRGPYRAKETIYKLEYPFRSVFVIKSGAVKTEAVLPNGDNHVTGFYFPGGLIGLEAIGDKHYNHDAIALVDTHVCEMRFGRLESLFTKHPHLQGTLLRMLSHKLRQNEALLTNYLIDAEKRTVHFFRQLSECGIVRRGRGCYEIELPMTKADVASYLRMRPESFSRVLRHLQIKGIILYSDEIIEFKVFDTPVRFVSKSKRGYSRHKTV